MEGINRDVAAFPPRPAFSYEEAFSRNIGWLTEWEQQKLRGKCVAIAGMGGVGGSHLLTLTRLGIGGFHIADFDHFELANFNRQAGAALDTIGQPKVDVLADMARRINPELRLNRFEDGVQPGNIDAFLAGVDLFIDGFDFFALDMRRRVHARCAERGIPAIIAAPLGLGTAMLVFRPGGMSFERYFRLDGLSSERQSVSFLLGLAPRGLHRGYLVDPRQVDLRGGRGPSTAPSCELCAGVAAVEAVKLLLGRGKVKAAPYFHQFDPYRGRGIVGRLRSGNANPVQRLRIALATPLAARLSRHAVPRSPTPARIGEIERIFEQARWAPSGDNTQPWRIEITGDGSAVLHLTDQTDHDLYDYRGGEPTLLAGGMLLESIAVAASRWGRALEWQYEGRIGHQHRIALRLPKRAAIAIDPLDPYLPIRSVDRRPYSLKRLGAHEKRMLEEALGESARIVWHESIGERWRFVSLGAKATAIRLRTPEAFPTHQRVIDWTQGHSPDGVPARAAGLARPSLPLMRWALKDWRRMRIVNALGGTLAAAVQMDYVPGLLSAGFFTVRGAELPLDGPGRTIGLLKAGRSIQRFWLTATRLGLAVQPAMGTLIFADHGARRPDFSRSSGVRRRAGTLAARFNATLGGFDDLVFMGRIGVPPAKQKLSRSIRRPLADLLRRRHDAGTAEPAFDPMAEVVDCASHAGQDD